MNKIDCSSEIIPGNSIGNIIQGSFIRDYVDNTDNKSHLSLSVIENSTRLVEYHFKECLKITVDVFYGRITNIIAHNSYTGMINKQIGLGLSIQELLQIDASFECCAGGLMSMNFPGICIYFTENFDADVSDLTPYLNSKILGIGLISQLDEHGMDNYVQLYGEKYFNLHNRPD